MILFLYRNWGLYFDNANERPVTVPKKIIIMYEKDINMQKLEIHLQLLPDAINLMPLDGIPIREVIQVQTICDILNNQPTFMIFITEVYELLKL